VPRIANTRRPTPCIGATTREIPAASPMPVRSAATLPITQRGARHARRSTMTNAASANAVTESIASASVIASTPADGASANSLSDARGVTAEKAPYSSQARASTAIECRRNCSQSPMKVRP
jgi:hypothetical protein